MSEKLSAKLISIVDEYAGSKGWDGTKVRPGYGPDKFYLQNLHGPSDSSLGNLIHHIMWEDGIYAEFLNER